MVDSNTKDFSQSIMELRYSWDKPDGTKETWEDICKRVGKHVLGVIDIPEEKKQEIVQAMIERKFIPGGRFLAQSGREWHQTNNCLTMRAEDTREGWGDLCNKATVALMSGAGIGVDYSALRPKGVKLKRTGGESSGCIPLIKTINEIGRGVIAGGNRRCLPSGTMIDTDQGFVPIEDVKIGSKVKTSKGYFPVSNKFYQGEQETIILKTQNGDLECTPNHRVAVFTKIGEYEFKMAKDIEEDDRLVFASTQSEFTKEYSLPEYNGERSVKAHTRVSITIPELDDGIAWLFGFFHGNGHVKMVEGKKNGKRNGIFQLSMSNSYPEVIEYAKAQTERFGVNVSVADLKTYSVIKAASVELAEYFLQFKTSNEEMQVPDFILNNPNESIRAAYLAGIFDADGSERTRPLRGCTSIYKKYIDQLQLMYTSLGIATRVKGGKERQGVWQPIWNINIATKSQFEKAENVIMQYSKKYQFLRKVKKNQFGYSYSSKILMSSPEIRKDKAIRDNAVQGLSRDFDTVHRKLEVESNLIPVMVKGIEQGRIVQTWDIEVDTAHEFLVNGIIVHNSAIYASLDWNHGDIFDFIHIKDWSEELRKIKEKDFDFPAPCDMTNISVNLDKSFFEAFENEDDPMHEHAQKVYWKAIHQMMKKAEPGFSINYKNKKESLRNAPVSGETWVVTPGKSVQIKNIVGQPTTIHTGYRWAENVVFELTEQDAEVLKIKLANGLELVLEPSHPVVIASKNGLRKIKAQNVKVGSQALVLNSEFMVETSEVVSISNAGTEDVYCADVHLPEHTFVANGIVVSNCTEIVSDKDSDVCCLGSLNFSKIESPEEVERITELGIIFLLAGTLYSDVPYDKVDEVRNEYRRLGLGIMGMAIWYAQRGLPYGDEESIRPWLEAWKKASDKAAKKWAKEFELNVPVATRAIAPNGSTSIAGGQTTGGIEPIFAKAYQRRYLTPEGWRRQYVIDPFVEELYNQGADIDKVEDAYDLALDVERRVRFQAFVQDEFVDNAISSTINLPAYGENGNNNEKEFGEMLYKYLPKLRGITAYPDGARGGQPLTKVDFEYAIKRKNIVFEAREDCTEGICGL